MFDFNSVLEFGRQVRVYRRREKLFRTINALTPELRKDIGWPASDANADSGPSNENMRWYARQANLGSMR